VLELLAHHLDWFIEFLANVISMLGHYDAVTWVCNAKDRLFPFAEDLLLLHKLDEAKELDLLLYIDLFLCSRSFRTFSLLHQVIVDHGLDIGHCFGLNHFVLHKTFIFGLV